MTLQQSFSGWEPKKLFHRTGAERFEDHAWVWGFDSRFDGRGLVAADLDGDGDLDLLMSNRGDPRLQLFENVGTEGNAFELELVSTHGHPEADGAVVQVEGVGAFVVTLARGFASSVSPRVHVGLGNRTEANVTVRWRSGVVEPFGKVGVGGVWQLIEGKAKPLPQVKFNARKGAPPHPWPSRLSDAVPSAKGPMLVQLFMRSCVPCREEVPALNALAAAGLHVTALGLHAADEIEAVRRELGMQYPAMTLSPAIAEAFESPGQGLALPTVLLYGADGQLLRVVPGGQKLEPVLAELSLLPKKE